MSSKAPAKTRILVENPEHLFALAGPHHRNLASLEEYFDVRAEAPGGEVTLTGAKEERARAKQVVDRLLAEIAAGCPAPTEDDVASACREVAEGVVGSDPASGLIRVGSKTFKGRTPAQLAYLRALNDPATPLVFGVGPAGTGKTFLAVAHAASMLVSRKIDRLIVARPAVEAGEKLGYLPGDLNEKIDPYMQPVWDALFETLGKSNVDKRRENRSIEVAPLAYMRGRTLKDACVIVDEAQNATINQMHMVLTRLGERSTMAVTGDPSQVDLGSSQPSGLHHALQILKRTEGVTQIEFSAKDVQRHPLVARIVDAYARDARRATNARETAASP